MKKHKIVLGFCCAVVLGLSGCSRQQSDWQKTREANSADAYEQFLKKYPSGEFTAQAQARVKELYEERDWQKARDTDTPEAYQAFLKQYPDGKWTEEARIRVENFTLAQAPSGPAAATPGRVESGGTESGVAANTSGAAPASAGAETAPAAPPPAPASAPPPPPPKPVAAAPAPPSPSVAAAPVPKPSPKTALQAKSRSAAYAVQLGAFKSGQGAAQKHWVQLQKEYPAALAGLSYKVLPKTTAGGKLYRLQAIDLTERRAREVCSALKAKSQACVVVPPGHGKEAV